MFSSLQKTTKAVCRFWHHAGRHWCRSAVSWLTIAAFVLGNVGFTVSVQANSSGQDHQAGGSCGCCQRGTKCACGCCPLPKARPAKASCCAKKNSRHPVSQPAQQTSHGPSLACPCSGTPYVDFAVSVQPKVIGPALQFVDGDHWQFVIVIRQPNLSTAQDGPETPPPRGLLG